MTRRGIVLIAAVVVIAVAATLVFVLDPFAWGPVPEPAPVYTIAIDAGHGGRDPGATVGDVYEKDVNLAVAEKLQGLVDAEPNLRAKMTRTLNIFVSLEDRIRIAEEAGAVIYVSVQANSYVTEEASGIETIVSDTRPQDDDAWILAELIQDAVSEATGARDRGARSQESYMHRAEIPAAMVEVGYLTNPEEREKLLDPAYQTKIAEGILNGIRQFIDWRYPANVSS